MDSSQFICQQQLEIFSVLKETAIVMKIDKLTKIYNYFILAM